MADIKEVGEIAQMAQNTAMSGITARAQQNAKEMTTLMHPGRRPTLPYPGAVRAATLPVPNGEITVVKLPPAAAFESRLAGLRRQLDALVLQVLDPKALRPAVAALAIANAGDDASPHGLAALRVGASRAEPEALGALVERVGGLAAAGKAPAFACAVQALERRTRVEGAVAAYA